MAASRSARRKLKKASANIDPVHRPGHFYNKITRPPSLAPCNVEVVYPPVAVFMAASQECYVERACINLINGVKWLRSGLPK